MWFPALVLAVSIAWIISFARGLQDVRRTEHIKPSPPPPDAPFVSVIVPARNEEDAVRECLDSLLRQDYPSFEIIVANDHSTDKTGKILAELALKDGRLRLADIPALPEGWTGKNHALHVASSIASPKSEWLLQTDADTVHAPQSISSSVKYALGNRLDQLSLFPHAVCHKAWEKLLLPSVGAMITLFNSPRKVNDPGAPDSAFANGQYLLVKKSAYEMIGGNAAVKDCVLEDAELSGKLKKAGFRTFLAYGENLFSTRMYSRFMEFLEGWSKNLFLIMGRSWLKVAGVVATSMIFAWVPLLALIEGVRSLGGCGIGTGCLTPLFLIGSYLMVLFFQTTLRHLGKAYPRYAVLAPIGSIVTSYLVLRSAFLISTRKGVTWKGRRYGGR
jgi:glycosyltransferase involved in cell wall biosynthesis